MRWLIVKDLQILRRSPLLVAVLIAYPVGLALMIGLALSSPPAKPRVAFLSQVPSGHGKIHLGTQQIDVSDYARQLFSAIHPVPVHTEAEAISAVRSGRALAAVIVPANLPEQLQSLITTGVGSPTIELILNARDPLERQYAEQAIQSRITDVEQAVSRQVLNVAVSDLHQVLAGGSIALLGQDFRLLGLKRSRDLIQHVIRTLPPHSPLRPKLGEVVSFANLAIEGLGFASPVLGSIGSPLTVVQTDLAGRTTPASSYGATIAIVFSLMLVAVLLGAGLLALEREEHTLARIVRGLVSARALLAEKAVLAGGCAATTGLLMAAIVAPFVGLDFSRIGLWIASLLVAGAAFGTLGVAIGALARDVRVASLLAFMLALPVAFVALVPTAAVSGAVTDVLRVLAFAFPFRAALDAANNAFNGTSPGVGWPLLHLVVLTAVFGLLARVALGRLVRGR